MNLPKPLLGLALVGALAGGVGVAAASDGHGTGDDQPVSADQSSDDSTPDSSVPGDISGPCDEPEHAGDPECAGVTVPGPTLTAPTRASTPSAPADGSVPTPGGTVTYSSDGSALRLVSAMPANGWRVEVEQSTGREIEVDFRQGTRRVQVNVEIEDGHARERVRLRDDATDTDVRIEDGVVEDRDGNSGHGGDDSDGGGNSGSG